MFAHAWLSPMRNHKLEVCPTFQKHVCGLQRAPRVVYPVFSISYRLFIALQWGGQLYMGVPCIHVCPCMAVPHEKPHIGSLSRLSNACRCVGSMPLGLFTMCLAWVSTCSLCFEKGDSDTWGFHAMVSTHAWLSPTRNYTLELCCTFQMDLCAQIVCPKGCLPYG